jgi:hypothetical protein
MRDQPTDRLAALEAQTEHLTGLVERLLAAQEQTAIALARLSPDPASTPAPPALRLVR